MLAPVEKVAVLALVYRTMYRECYSGAISLHEDMECYPEGVSLLGMIGSQALTDEDWALVALMEEHYSPAAIASDIAAWDSCRCEALLHAWPHDPRDDLPDAEWTQPFLARWPLVETVMTGFEPVTWSRERKEEVAATRHGGR
ncbi:MAG: hypothetical protein ACRDNI_06815 [Gaiellaceae bacterium]